MKKYCKSYSCMIMENNFNPKKLLIDGFDENYIAVKSHDAPYITPLCIPQEIVFEWDELLFNRLKEAFDSGDTLKLEKLWKEAVPWLQSNISDK